MASNLMKVDLSEQEWVRALNAMALAPYREVQPLIASIMTQLEKQKQEAAKAE